MPTITLKNIPDSLYRNVKKRAKQNKRSINGEILYVLEHIVSEESHEKDKLLRKIRKHRSTLPKINGLSEIDDFKKAGRP